MLPSILGAYNYPTGKPLAMEGFDQGRWERDQVEKQRAFDRTSQMYDVGGQNYRADVEAGTRRHGIDTDADTARRGQDVQMALGNRGYDVQAEGNRLQYDAAMAPINWGREKWGQVFPLLTGLLGRADAERVGGANRPQPAVTAGGVYSDQETQENVNAARAGIDQQAASRQRATETKLAGQGFGRRSPLLAAMQAQIGGQAMAAGADAERELRTTAAEQNAKQRLAAEDLMQQQWRDYEDADIRRRQATTNQTSALLSALAAFG